MNGPGEDSTRHMNSASRRSNADPTIGYPTAIVLTGMHRSGTSLLARFLNDAGIDMGDRLLGATRGNPFGHFEDEEILEFHRKTLRANGTGVRPWRPRGMPRISDEIRREARALAQARREKGVPWGWKEPRTTLLLELWEPIIPEARYLLVYRDPSEVCDSLARRGDYSPADWYRQSKSFYAWLVYNRNLLRFHRKHPDRSILFNIHDALAARSAFVAAVNEVTGMSLDAQALESAYEPKALSSGVTTRYRVLPWLRVQARLLYRELERSKSFCP